MSAIMATHNAAITDLTSRRTSHDASPRKWQNSEEDFRLLATTTNSLRNRYPGAQIFNKEAWVKHFSILNGLEKERFLDCLLKENLLKCEKRGKFFFPKKVDEQFLTAESLKKRCELYEVFKPHTGGRQKGYKLSEESRAQAAEKRRKTLSAKKEAAEKSLLQMATDAAEQIVKVRSYLTEDSLKEVLSCLQEEQTLRQERKARQEKLQEILYCSEMSLNDLKTLIKEVESC